MVIFARLNSLHGVGRMNNPSRFFAMVEDQRQMQFLYRFLLCQGIRPHEITIDFSPSARGSAEQWVRENFARQAGKCRARNTRASTGMFVMLDAVTRTIRERLNALDEALTGAEQPPVSRERDPIARLIPKRNLETWILFLSARGAANPVVDEQQDYKQRKTTEEWSGMIPPASEVLLAWTRPDGELPDNLLDSLRLGLQEIPRALPTGR
jgi:hypothetical protein